MFTVAFRKSQRLSGYIREYEFVTQTGQACPAAHLKAPQNSLIYAPRIESNFFLIQISEQPMSIDQVMGVAATD